MSEHRAPGIYLAVAAALVATLNTIVVAAVVITARTSQPPPPTCAAAMNDVNADLDNHPEDLAFLQAHIDPKIDQACGYSGAEQEVIRIHRPPVGSYY